MQTMASVNILIVDDIAHNITALQALLARDGVNLLVAQSGTAALELLLVHEVALALLDVNMPDMNGFELASLMRGSSRTAHVPIIFLTATTEEASRTFRGYEAGAVDFLYKPVNPRILQAKVDVFVQLERHKRLLAEELQTSRALLAANEMLMAVLGHDLRTPLGAVLSSAEYLLREPNGPQTVKVANRIKSSSQRMARMVHQLLNLARLQGGRLQLQREAVQLGTLCRSIADEFRGGDGGGRVEIVERGDGAGNWDGDLLWQAISNLVSNALQHGEPDSVVTVEVDGEAANRVSIKVRNRGVIDESLVPHLFEAFGPGAADTPRRAGLGLGLHIVEKIAQMHRGTVKVVTDEADHTSFRIELPRADERDETASRG
ncbi:MULTISPECIES: hybrid sensor histidine kinase/response regulator [unclassified Burkholderia]|uniref:hybrid sensor histidine kinase/response regulator n=1 Tax=unclassified Burkholderia TaxID=2613784 RepID=UPI00142427E8|nr:MULTISPECIES: hybrid sensor histidine kinase/response regulator [unclassified Burkholderia]NIE82980.1 response regulator [Burkholderia sp. Tr-860]NIF61595.1 response regulator [Burkholderia sp. Cy-647]NIF95006.1 response regulator [Burkholderia sp. Ax-1720]